MTFDVFVTYSIHDRAAAARLRHALEYYGLSVWPNHIMTPGTREWVDTYQTIMDRACCVLLLLSPNTTYSTWVAMALEYANLRPIPLMPLLVSGKADHILLATLRGDDWFDLRWNSRYSGEVRALTQWIKLHYQRAVV